MICDVFDNRSGGEIRPQTREITPFHKTEMDNCTAEEGYLDLIQML